MSKQEKIKEEAQSATSATPMPEAKRASKVREQDVPAIAEHLEANFGRSSYFIATAIWLVVRDRFSWAEARIGRNEVAIEIADALASIGELPKLGADVPLTLPLLARIVAYSEGDIGAYPAVLARWTETVGPRPERAGKAKAERPTIDVASLF